MEFPIQRYAGNLGTNRLISRVIQWVRDGQAYRVDNTGIRHLVCSPKTTLWLYSQGRPREKKVRCRHIPSQPSWGLPYIRDTYLTHCSSPYWLSVIHLLVNLSTYSEAGMTDFQTTKSYLILLLFFSSVPPPHHSKVMEGLKNRNTAQNLSESSHPCIPVQGAQGEVASWLSSLVGAMEGFRTGHKPYHGWGRCRHLTFPGPQKEEGRGMRPCSIFPFCILMVLEKSLQLLASSQ